MELAIRGALVAGSGGVYAADIGISGGEVAAVAAEIRADREIDGRGLVALPGVIDPHVHLEDVGTGGIPTADDFASGTASAAAGGVTTILDFVSPAPGQDFLEAFRARRELAARGSRVDFGLHCCIPWHGDDPAAAVRALAREGVTSIKTFTAYDGLALTPFEMFRVMRAVADEGLVMMVHAETGEVIDGLTAEFLARGDTAPVFHAYSRPGFCEEAAVAQILAIHRAVGGHLYFVHVSTSAAARLIAAEKRAAEPEGLTGERSAAGGPVAVGPAARRVFMETCPQYLLLSEDKLTGPHGERFICSPPLRPRSEREPLWGAVSSGAADTIGTDHCPFKAGDREGKASYAEVPNGLGGLGFSLELMFTAGVAGGRIGLERLVALTSENAARIFGLWPGKGRIAPGADADIVLIDPSSRHELSAESLPGGEDYSVYEGFESVAAVEYTISRGEVVYDRRKGVLGEPGRGRYIARSKPVD